MNKLYRKNMKLIKKLSIDLHRKIENTKVESVEKSTCKNGDDNLIKKTGSHSYALHSTYNPKKYAERLCSNTFKGEPDIVLVFGLGLGYEIREMIKYNPNVRYFIVEPDAEIFKMALHYTDISFLFNSQLNIYFIQDNREKYIVSFFDQLLGYDKKINIKVVILPSYEVVYKDLVEKVNKELKKILRVFKVNVNTEIYMKRQWVQNIVANLQYLKTACSITGLKKPLKNVPAIIVGGGPSLSYNIEHLKKVGNKALIVGAGTGFKLLDRHGVKAHAAGAIDGSVLELDLFTDITINKDAALFYTHNVYYKVPRMLNGHKFLMNVTPFDQLVVDALNFDAFPTYSGPSITNVLAYNLSRLGCNPIIFLGQDLCYSEAKLYASGVEDIKKEEFSVKEAAVNKTYRQMKNKKREMVYTTTPFLTMKDLMEDCIRQYINTTYLNGSENGLHIEGAEDINFNQFVDEDLLQRPDYPITKVIAEVYEQGVNHVSCVVDKIVLQVAEDNKNMMEICKNLLICLEDDTITNEQKQKYIEECEERLEKIWLYKEGLQKMFVSLEYIYDNQDVVQAKKNRYADLLDKCLIIENALIYELNDGKPFF